ncbi:MAG: GTP-binding protein [Cyanobacteria bacterium J06648_11]
MSTYARLLAFLFLLGLFIGLMVWGIQSFLDLYYAVRSSWLGLVLVGLTIALLLAFAIAAFYYLFLFGRQRSQSRGRAAASEITPPQNPSEKTAVTHQNLNEATLHIQAIADRVAREGFAAQSAAIARDLEQPRLKVTFYGTGSAGKTSLIAALLGQSLGSVGAPIGTTERSALYCWPLDGIRAPVDAIDSPGLSDMGEAGIERENAARELAQTSDLLVFVLDGDLRQSEYAPLMELAHQGKRSILVLNKVDRFTAAERDLLLAHLRERVRDVIAPEDVLPAAANPSPVELANETFYPPPDVDAVRQRIHAILLAEGRTLMLDNALLRSQQLGAEVQRILGEQMEQSARRVVDRYAWIVTAAVFANPLPVVDLLATAAINAQMVVALGKVYGCQLDIKQGRELAASLAKTLAGLGLVEGSIQLATGVMNAMLEVTVVGFLATAPIQAASAGHLTRIAGRSFIEYFKRDRQWGTGGMQAVVSQQAQQAKQERWMAGITREVMRRLVEASQPFPPASNR